jgi:DNA-binding NarL/FixJ family response regulator
MDSAVPVSVCIAAPTGIFANSLSTFLSTIPEVRVVSTVGDWQDLEILLQGGFGCTILLDVDLTANSTANRLKLLTCRHPSCLIVVLVNTNTEQRMALAAGARTALLKGNLGEQLRRAVLGAAVPPSDDLTPAEQPR